MTPRQIKKFNQMRAALLEISKYQSTEKLRKDSKGDWGLDYEEALEMAYENVVSRAKHAVKGVKILEIK